MTDETSGDPERLKEVRVFVVEDEAAIALLLEDMLDDFGCRIVGPFARVDAACEGARSESMDVALLDVNVGGQPINPVVEILAARNVPMVFSTGYRSGGDLLQGKSILEKPFTQSDLERKLLEALRNPA